jgi:hypothetical protein
MKCIVGNGELWDKCANHMSIDGQHGTFLCKWIDRNKDNGQHYGWNTYECNCPSNKTLEFTDEEFLI